MNYADPNEYRRAMVLLKKKIENWPWANLGVKKNYVYKQAQKAAVGLDPKLKGPLIQEMIR
jgi:hypothetical protein